MTSSCPVDSSGPRSGHAAHRQRVRINTLAMVPSRGMLARHSRHTPGALRWTLLLATLLLAIPQARVAAQAPAATATPATEITPAPDAPRIDLEFTELNDSGISGTATLSAAGDQTIVQLRLQDTGENHPAHIHAGTCDDLQPDFDFPLANVRAEGTSTTVVDRPLQALVDGEFAIDVHLSPNELGTLVACVDIDGQPTVPASAGTPGAATAAVATPATPTEAAAATVPPAPTEAPFGSAASALATAVLRAATSAIATVTAASAAVPPTTVPPAPTATTPPTAVPPTSAPTTAPTAAPPSPTPAPTTAAAVAPTPPASTQPPQSGTVIEESTPAVDDGTGGGIPPAATAPATAPPVAGVVMTPPPVDGAPTVIPPIAGAIATTVPPAPEAPPPGDGTQGGIDDSGKGVAIVPAASGVGGSGASASIGPAADSGDGTQGDIADAGKGVPLDPTTGLPSTAGTGSSLDWPASPSSSLPWIMVAMSIALLIAGTAIRSTASPHPRPGANLR